MRPAAACRQFRTLSTPLATLVLSIALAQAASAATLSGRVTDPDGRAVAGAQVVVSTALGTTAVAVTDAAGAYEITRLPGGTYDVRVLAEGFQADPRSVMLTDDGRADASVQLRVSALTESIVVSASQIELPLSRAADAVTVITAADIRMRQIETVSDALRLVAGLSVTRSGGRGAITSLFPRGGGSNYTLVLVDGMRVNAFGGGYDFAHLSVADIDRIEIVRGPQSALFGSDAIGAVVHIVTRRGGRPRVDALVEGGSQGTARAAIGAAGAAGDWIWGAGAERTDSDGYTGLAASGEPVANDDYNLRHASGTLGWRRPQGADFLLNANISRDERGFPGPFGSDPIAVFSGVDRVSRGVNDTRQIGARFSHSWTAKVRQRVEASYTDLAGEFVSGFGLSTTGTRRFDARVQEDVAITPALGASAGIEILRERGSSTFITGAAGQEILIERGVSGAYGEIRLAGGERLFVTGGIRVEHLTRDALEPDPFAFVPRPAFPSQTIASLNPKIAASYLVTAPGRRLATRVRASAGAGIRPPNAFEVAFTDNPELAPERSRSVDAGVEQQFAGGAYAVAATVFFNRYDDLIVTVGRSLSDASRYRTDNISNARARGLELSADARLRRGFAVRGNYTFLSTEILSVDGLDRLAPAPFKVGDSLIRRPRHQGLIEVTYASTRVSAFADLALRSQILDVEPNFGSFGGLFFSSGYSVLNAGVTVPIAKGLHLFARGLNLTDRAYEETLGYPALGRSGMFGVRVAAGR
jgi:outer membrane cobalamin receptor